VATLLFKTPGSLAVWRSEKTGPPYVKVGQRILYPRKALDAWIAANTVIPGKPGRAA